MTILLMKVTLSKPDGLHTSDGKHKFKRTPRREIQDFIRLHNEIHQIKTQKWKVSK